MNWLRLHVSNLCNFKCPNCHVFELGENNLPSKVMAQDIFDKSIETYTQLLKENKLDEALISIYGGETLANKKVIKAGIVKYGRSYSGIKLNWVLNTNGSLLNEEDVLFFKEHNIELHISVDGKEEIHNLSRPTHKGKGTFHMVTPALELVKKHKALAQINSYMMPSNYNNLKDLVDIAVEYNIPKIYLDQFYNLDMISHKVGMEKYRSVYLYGMLKNVQISGPWNKVVSNFNYQTSRENFLKKNISLDVNIDGSCYFPIYVESKMMGYTLDNILEKLSNKGWDQVVSKTLARNEKTCDGCEIKEHCNGVAIEQVQYHISSDADPKVSCDFFRDWSKFMMRPVYFKNDTHTNTISLIDLDLMKDSVVEINSAISKLQNALWPLTDKITVNVVEHHEEIMMATKLDYLPEWTTAVAKNQTIYLKGNKLSPAIIHELIHVFLNQQNINAPEWFLEGVCEFYQGKGISPQNIRDSFKKDNLFEQIKKSKKIVLIKENSEIPEKNALYIQSYGFVDYVNKLLGEKSLKDFLFALKTENFRDTIKKYTKLNLEECIENFSKENNI